MKRYFIALFSIFFITNFALNAQELNQDSVDLTRMYSKELQELADIQKKDSLKRVQLENEFLKQDVKNTKEYRTLINEINLLKSKDSLVRVKRIQKIDSLKTINQGFSVAPFDSSLFFIYNKIGSYSAAERAQAIEKRILALTDNYKFDPDSLILVEDDNGVIIMWNDQMLMTVNENDALWMNTDMHTLANSTLDIVKSSIKIYREKNSLKELAIDFGLALLIISVLILIIFGLNKLFSLLKIKILQKRGTKLNGLFIKNYELISGKKLIRFLWAIADFVKWISILTVVYLALPILFNLFPATEGYAPLLIDYFVRPLKKIGVSIVGFVPNFITILIVILIFKYSIKLIHYFATEIQSGALTINGFYKEWAIPTYHILKVLLLAFNLIVVFPYLPGSDSPFFKGVSVFIGVLFTFGSTGAISNIVAGLVLTYMRSFSVGDRIKIGEVTGDVIEKSILVTRIRTIKNEVISIPNSQVMNSHTVNYSIDDLGNGLIVYTNITISYDVPWQKVHKLAIEAASKVEFLEQSPAPFVFQSSLDEFCVTYQINAYTKKPNLQAVIYSELNKQILDSFHHAGIELLSIRYSGWRDASSLKIPSQD